MQNRGETLGLPFVTINIYCHAMHGLTIVTKTMRRHSARSKLFTQHPTDTQHSLNLPAENWPRRPFNSDPRAMYVFFQSYLCITVNAIWPSTFRRRK